MRDELTTNIELWRRYCWNLLYPRRHHQSHWFRGVKDKQMFLLPTCLLPSFCFLPISDLFLIVVQLFFLCFRCTPFLFPIPSSSHPSLPHYFSWVLSLTMQVTRCSGDIPRLLKFIACVSHVSFWIYSWPISEMFGVQNGGSFGCQARSVISFFPIDLVQQVFGLSIFCRVSL